MIDFTLFHPETTVKGPGYSQASDVRRFNSLYFQADKEDVFKTEHN